MRVLGWLRRLDDLARGREGFLYRLLLLVAVVGTCTGLIVDWQRTPAEGLRVGDVAPRTVKAGRQFTYVDFAERSRLQEEARAAVLPVYRYRSGPAVQARSRVQLAYQMARQRLEEALAAAEIGDPADLPAAAREDVQRAFRAALGEPEGFELEPDEVVALLNAGFPERAEQLGLELLEEAMSGYILSSRDELPPDRGTILVVSDAEGSTENPVTDLGLILVPPEARKLDLGSVIAKLGYHSWVEPAANVTRFVVGPNLFLDAAETTARRDTAAANVPPVEGVVKKGSVIFTDGEVLTESHLARYRTLQNLVSHPVWLEMVTVAAFLLLLIGALYQFGSSYLQGFSTRLRDVAAVASLFVLSAVMARGVASASGAVAEIVGYDCQPESIWYLVPVAGAAILVRLLVGVQWALVFSVATSALCGLVMDLGALYVCYFVISATVASGAVEHTRERLGVLRAGLFTGVVNAASVLVFHFLLLYFNGEVGEALNSRPVWSMGFAFSGGVLSSFLVLSLMPAFETLGFVTDYRMMELANLNHPLMRQLMLRAPGSYHHSVVVGSLSEAACEAIGANALQARVAAYFHDIGKSMKPQYFIENQKRPANNRHNTLNPRMSAEIIISHVTEGARMAREYRLPKPIVDNIYMHHGDGLLQYFYAKAVELADDPSSVKESDFRYPGPKPNTREAGVIMLADKVEAATRTIREPNARNIRAMINRIINSVMSDGQFEDCPITFQELYTVGDAFVNVLVGIHHQRIEYPQTASISRGGGDKPAAPAVVAREAVITLEMPNPLTQEPAPERVVRDVSPPPSEPRVARDVVALAQAREAGAADLEEVAGDYESIEHLPRGHR